MGFSCGVWKWECFRTVECQQVESSRWMEQQQKKRDGPVQCVCEERRASEHRKSAEPEVVHGSVPARWDTLEWLWSAPCESVQSVYIPVFLTKRYSNIPTGPPNRAPKRGRQLQGYNNIAIFVQYLALPRNDTDYSHSCFGMRIGNRAQAFWWYDF